MKNNFTVIRNFLTAVLMLLLCTGMVACGASPSPAASAAQDVTATAAPPATQSQSEPPAIQHTVSAAPAPTPTLAPTPPEAQLSTDPLGLMRAGVLEMTKEEFELSDIFATTKFEPSTEVAEGFWSYGSGNVISWINDNDSVSFTGEPSGRKWISYSSNGGDSISMIDSMDELTKQLAAQYGACVREELAFIDKDGTTKDIEGFDVTEAKKILDQGIQSMGCSVSWQADKYRINLNLMLYTGAQDSCTVTLEYSNIT